MISWITFQKIFIKRKILRKSPQGSSSQASLAHCSTTSSQSSTTTQNCLTNQNDLRSRFDFNALFESKQSNGIGTEVSVIDKCL